MLTMMVQDVHFLWIEDDAARLIVLPRIICPTVPQAGYDRLELTRPAVAFVVLDMFGQSEIESCIGIGGRDDVPSRTPIADVIERGKPASDMVGFVEGR